MDLPNKKLILYQIFFIFIVPVVIIYFGIVPVDWRYAAIAVSALLIMGIIRHERWSYRELGIRADNLKSAFKPYLYLTILGILFLFIYERYAGAGSVAGVAHYKNAFLLFIQVSFLQELAYRSFLMPRLGKILNSAGEIVFVNALLFTMLHAIYPLPFVNLPLAFISGIAFAGVYYFYPNLILITLSHALLNLTAAMLGFFQI